MIPNAERIRRVVLRVLGIILLAAAVLKGHQLLTEPLVGTSIWSYRPLLVFQVECELALGIWLLSGLFPTLAWLASLACFGLFSSVTLYKGLTGAESCGCFGAMHVNPWVTLSAIDLPAVVALALLRPEGCLAPLRSFLKRQESVTGVLRRWLLPFPSPGRSALTAGLLAAVLAVTTPILAFAKPARITTTYEVLEPLTWVGRELPILGHIDIAEQLRKGTWLLLFYHYDCPDCQRALPEYERMARDLAGNEDFLRIALIAVPPYGPPLRRNDSPCTLGRLADIKEWFITTPAVAVLSEARVKAVWEQSAPNLETVISEITNCEREFTESLAPQQQAL
jgi:thiol-disulfide isomerase/thioredoxin